MSDGFGLTGKYRAAAEAGLEPTTPSQYQQWAEYASKYANGPLSPRATLVVALAKARREEAKLLAARAALGSHTSNQL